MGLFDIVDEDDDILAVAPRRSSEPILLDAEEIAEGRYAGPGGAVGGCDSVAAVPAVSHVAPLTSFGGGGPVVSDAGGGVLGPCGKVPSGRNRALGAKGAEPAKKRRRTTKQARSYLNPPDIPDSNSRKVDLVFINAALTQDDKPTDSTMPSGPAVSVKKVSAPIPLAIWPVYTLNGDCGHPALANGTADRLGEWAVIGCRERWLHELLVVMKIKIPDFLKQLRSPYSTALSSARKSAKTGMTTTNEDSDEGESSDEMHPEPRVSLAASLVMKIVLFDRELTVLNTCRPMVIQVNQSFLSFVATDIPRFAAAFKENNGVSEEPLPLPPPAPFTLPPSPMPNIRGKVSWVPSSFAWRVEITKPRKVIPPYVDMDGRTLRVDRLLPRGEYESAKKDAYERAIETWNAVDGSTRHRITAMGP